MGPRVRIPPPPLKRKHTANQIIKFDSLSSTIIWNSRFGGFYVFCYGEIAQLVRASDSYSGGRWFETISRYYFFYMETNFPKYIWRTVDSDLGRNALALVRTNDKKALYWRHGGQYEANAYFEDGKLMVSISHCEPFEYTECTEDEWRASNGDYASEEYDFWLK